MKGVRRGKRRNTDLTVRDILLDTVPWAVLEEEANVALAPLSVKDKSLFENSSLIERMVERENMFKAYERVVKNRGSAGIDEMSVEDLKPYLQKEWVNIKIKLLDSKYKPQPVKRVEIPKPGGGTRKLGIPTVTDRLIQQALHQELDLIFDADFSDSSYGFRRGRSAHQAVEQFRDHVASGKKWVVDIDLEKFFDLVNHDVLMARVERKVKDKKVLKLIRSYLKVGYLDSGVHVASTQGMPQGGPLSPILSNILLDDLDKELEQRGHSFTRYADDVRIYVSSRKAGDRVLKSISSYLGKVLRLRVNEKKSQVVRASRSTFLGYSLTHHRVPKLRVPRQSLQKLKQKLKVKFRMGRGRNLMRFIQDSLNKSIKGWINYFKLAEVKRFAQELDGWIRRRLRNIKWRQWKRPWTRRSELIKRGLGEERSVQSAFNQRGPWWNSGASHMNYVFPKKYFDKLGLVSILDELQKFKIKLRNRRGT